MRKKPRDYGATRGTVASLLARPIEDIPSGSSEANKARITPGSSPPARSQGPRKVKGKGKGKGKPGPGAPQTRRWAETQDPSAAAATGQAR